jgi:tetratricopeptide (TPR) repeat protein
VTTRRFRIEVGACRRCGREWPTYLELCKECAATIGEPRLIPCGRVVPPLISSLRAPALVVAIAVELSRRRPPPDDGWAAQLWGRVAPELAGAVRVRPGPAGSITAAWSLERSDAVATVAEVALDLPRRLEREIRENTELRGGIAIGVAGVGPESDAVERCAERLALAAASGQWLVSDEVARRLQERFQLGPVGIVPRWPMPFVAGHRALVARLAPPVLPSAIRGEVPRLVLGRAAERCRLSAEIASAAAGRRRVVLVSAPAGGGKSYLLRRVLADADIKLAAGVAFPPLGSHPMGPLRALLAGLDATEAGCADRRLGAVLGEAATRRARVEPSAIVVDDIHWATPDAVAALLGAISATATDLPLAWILSTRTAALGRLRALGELADIRLELPALEPVDRMTLLARWLGEPTEAVLAHVARGVERGNPLYLDHLAEVINEGCAENSLPGTLHEAVLARLDGLAGRARMLAHWSNGSQARGGRLEALERELGDWLDRLETTDVADLETIGRYLARLRAADFELVVARSLLGMPVPANRRLAWAVERLAAASSDALLDYLEAVASDGRRTQAAHEALAAAERAERALRLDDAERLLEFANRHDPRPELAGKRGDLALALGRPHDALQAYRAAAAGGDPGADLERRVARAEALTGEVDHAVLRLENLTAQAASTSAGTYAAMLDLARLRALPPPPTDGLVSAPTRRRIARTKAWARAGDSDAARQAVGSLVLASAPAACAAELIDTAALSRLAGLSVGGLATAATDAARRLSNPRAIILLDTANAAEARRMFVHWDV